MSDPVQTLKDEIDINPALNDFRGMIRKSGAFHFIDIQVLLRFFLITMYPENIVVVLYNCKNIMEMVPRLQVLKRDNWGAYTYGKISDIVIVEFTTQAQADDWAFSLPGNGVEWEMYKNATMVRNRKGVVKHG